MAKHRKTHKAEEPSLPDELEIKVYKVPDGRKRAGLYTFTVNGQESLLYSGTRDGLNGKIKMLMIGPDPGHVTLKAQAAAGKTHAGESADAQAEKEWWEYPTQAERVAAFMSRGKLKGDGGG